MCVCVCAYMFYQVTASGTELVYISIEKNEETELVAVTLEDEIAEDTDIELYVKYFGPITNDMAGMYYSYYYEEADPTTRKSVE